ncbi:unnamed protein product [Rhizopus stolonifer]
MNHSNKDLEDYYEYTTQTNENQDHSLNDGQPINYPLDLFYDASTFPELNPLNQATFQTERHDFLDSSINYPTTSTDPFGLSQSEDNLLMNAQDANVLMSTFNPDFYTQQLRQEQEMFSELIDLAKAKTPERSHPLFQTIDNNKLDRFYKSSETKVNQKDKLVYDLKIVQQPLRARMCGFGDKDRRPIVPAPILQLFVTDNEGNDVDPEDFDVTFLVVLCDSCLQTGEPATSATSVSKMSHSVPVSQVVVFSSSEDRRNPRTSKLKNLVGSSAVSANKLYDLNDKLGIFFIFHDISLRTEGTFLLKFSLVDVGLPHAHKVNTNELSQVIQIVYSAPLEVFTAKKYPGVVEATPLSMCFAQQGIKIPVRKDPSGLKNKQKTSDWS